MEPITGGEAAYQALVKLGVEHVFGIPSVHNLPIMDAIQRGGGIDVVTVRHEQAAVHSADGYARASGRLGVVLASTGPGTTNTMTGLYEAAFASSPVMVLTGQADSIYYGKSRGAGHEAEKQWPMLQTVARRVESPRYTQEIAPAIFRVAADIQTGRPQPGAVEMPIDIQYATTTVPVGDPHAVHPVTPGPDSIARAVEALGNATRRVILAGGGVVGGNASDELLALAQKLNAPVFTSTNGRGALPSDHALCMGPWFGARQAQAAIADAEVVLAVGTWFHGGPHNWQLDLPGTLIHVDVDPQAHGLVHRPDISVIGDARLALAALEAGMNPRPGDDAFLDAARRARDEIQASARQRIGPDMEIIMDHLRDRAGRDAIVVRDMTTPAYAWGNSLLPIFAPRSTMNPTSGAIGPGLPLANGAAVATGRKTVVIHGDGGFMVHIGELATTVQYGLPLVICVFTDGGYGVLRGMQENNFGGRQIAVNLATPNFATVARGMGLSSERVKGASQFRQAFDRAMAAEGPYLIDIDMTTLAPMEGWGALREFTQPE